MLHKKFAIWFFVLSYLSPFAAAVISPNLSVNQGAYELLERLEAYGCVSPLIRVIKPMSQVDLRQTLINKEGSPCAAPEWLLREGNAFAVVPVPSEGRLRFLSTSNDNVALPGIEASVTPMIPFHGGIPFFNGPNLYLELTTAGTSGKDFGLAFAATAGFMGGLDNYQTLNGRFYLREGYVKLGYKTVEATVGRQQLEFGEARHGDLALALSFRPLDALRFSIRPQTINGLEFLGSFTFDSWITNLGDSNFVSNSTLWGISIGLRPAYWLEVAVMETFQFGGSGAGVNDLSASDIFSMISYAGGSDLDTKRHRSLASQIAVWAPSHLGKVYSQFLFDGLSRPDVWFANDVSVILGIWIPNLGAGIDARLEYAHTVPGAYENAIWKQGFVSQGTPFGHPLGPGGQGAYFDLGFPPIDGWKPQVNVAYEARGLGLSGVGVAPEYRYVGSFGISKQFEKTSLQATITCAKINNPVYLAGLNTQECAGQALIGYQLY